MAESESVKNRQNDEQDFPSVNGQGNNTSSSPKLTGRRNSTMLYQCTWRGCNFQCLQCHVIEQHVRVVHLG